MYAIYEKKGNASKLVFGHQSTWIQIACCLTLTRGSLTPTTQVLSLMYLHFHFQSLEPDPTVDYMEKPGTATKRKQTGGEEQGIYCLRNLTTLHFLP